jgi:hypothetical protein
VNAHIWAEAGLVLLGAAVIVHAQPVPVSKKIAELSLTNGDRLLAMSASGRTAYLVSRSQTPNQGKGQSFRAASGVDGHPGTCLDNVEDPECEGEGPGGNQTELAIAVDPTGMHIVVGFNDSRGFDLNPIRVSGYAWSDNGGLTFTDGGPLPSAPAGSLGTLLLPQVFGDPDVKYVPGGAGCQFIYSSILARGVGPAPNYTGVAQTMAVHRSTDCGHTWQGPFEVTAATNPHGLLAGTNAGDDADKEFIDVDPETGRVLMAWTNFTATAFHPSGTEIRTAFSDNIMSATPPTWSAGVVVNSGINGVSQAAMPRFAGNGSKAVYLVYGVATAQGNNVAFSRSTDNGLTWSVPANIQLFSFILMDQVLGNDRSHNMPALAVDNSPGPYKGYLYVVCANNNSFDGSDIMFWRSTDRGTTWSPGRLINASSGNDRPQWYPTLAVDQTTGRVNLLYDDQGAASSGDEMQMTWQFSDDGGSTLSKPSYILRKPFHAGYGNDTGQPNLGDYNMIAARNGIAYAAFSTNPDFARFSDVDPGTGRFPYPSFLPGPNPIGFAKLSDGKATLQLGAVTFTDSGGNGHADAGDQIRLKFPLRNFVTNPPLPVTSITADLTTSTPDVTVLAPTRTYPDIIAGATAANTSEFIVRIAPTFTPGARIAFDLAVTALQGTTTLRYYLETGTPVAVSTLISENFNGVAPGALPAGWSSVHTAGTKTVGWTTTNSFCGATSNGFFHRNGADDGTLREGGLAPIVTVPPTALYVTLDFDLCYATEHEPSLRYWAWDGALLRVTDFTSGVITLAEASADYIKTGSILHYPRHLPRSNDTSYFQDMSVWAGDSGNAFVRVATKFSGMEGRSVQPRWDYTQDSVGTCLDVPPFRTSCGVMVDNVVMTAWGVTSNELLSLTLRPVAGSPGKFTATLESQAVAPPGGITAALASSTPTQTTMPASVTIPAGRTTAPPFTVTITAQGTLVTITATTPSNSRSAGVLVP